MSSSGDTFPMDTYSSFLLALSLSLSLVVLKKYLDWRRLVAATPPGLPPLPLIGNYFNIPKRDPYATYLEWGKKYNSELVSVRSFGQHTIVINTENAARNILSKRAQIYSDRPYIAMYELIGWDWNTASIQYGDRWRARRRALHRMLNITAVHTHLPIQMTEVRKFLLRLRDDPKRFLEHIKFFSTGIAMQIAYAHEVTENDPFIEASEKAFSMLGQCSFPGAALVNAFPILRHLPTWFPGATFHDFARRCKALTDKMRFKPLEKVKREMVYGNGTAVPSIARTMLESESSAKDDILIADIAGIIYAGGSDTLASSLSSLISGLALFPDVQKRAWEEIDSIVGRSRLPAIEDRDSMPYIEAICRETVRFRSVVPLGVNRLTVVDDEYDGYLIPKCVNILWNSWAMSRDPVAYPDPLSFKPERWLDESGQFNGKEFEPAFGYGRRVCVGINLTKSSLWQAASCFISVMEVRKSKDENGKEIDITLEDTGGIVSHPLPFECDIFPRDQKAKDLLDKFEH